MRSRPWIAACLGAALAAGCGDAPRLAEDVYAPLGEPRPDCTPEELATFERGLAVARRRWTPDTGLGPTFNVTFCAGCHEKPVSGGSAGHYRDFLLVRQVLPDDSFVSLGVNGIQDQFTLEEGGRNPSDPATNLSATRNPIPFYGVGLLAEIPESSILANADPDDTDGDGISGRPNFDRGFVGRFGRKAQTVSLEGFIRGPLFNHLGITSTPLPASRKAELPVPSAAPPGAGSAPLEAEGGVVGHSLAQAAAPEEPTVDLDAVPDPELVEDDLFDIVAFTMLLAAPEPEAPTAASEAGRVLFDEVGCTGCHVPTLRGPRGLIPAYTDLLLHDMGPELDDGLVMGVSLPSEFRTQPLWGVVAAAPYLHDGRAATLEEAILLHGGEAQAARDAFAALSASARDEVLAFLEALGGGAQRSEGLLPPGAPVPATGSYGGPATSLDATAMAEFVRGRELFDRDMAPTEGLGPRFNGDSCRACHFDPVLGGGGPAGVDVTRHAIFDPMTGMSADPEQGTMAHRHALDGTRPPVDPLANHFETRQTPPLFGLGLVEQIPRATIAANADPDDLAAPFGVSGRLPDLDGDPGTTDDLGRFGWKADIRTLRDFARDALFMEAGITTGAADALATDGDAVPDPELPDADLDALVFFLENLGPPPRTRTDPAAEDAGAVLFSTFGCDACHVPSLTLADGVTEVPLYSDLLLHDIAPAGAEGIAVGAALETEFRTAPLWGLGRTAPYMHDGRSFTVEEAIVAHDGEAAAAESAYAAASAGERAALLAFLASL